MELIAYLILLVGPDLDRYVARDGLCLPPNVIEYQLVSCPPPKPRQDGYERVGGRWVPRMVYPMTIPTIGCAESVCVQGTKSIQPKDAIQLDLRGWTPDVRTLALPD
jgi:hypothetical protein